jgi:diguanylate cyclase (GGDEF)-like protein/PAS domain S-box-containing protein
MNEILNRHMDLEALDAYIQAPAAAPAFATTSMAGPTTLEEQIALLRRTLSAVEEARDRYLDLYEDAPVGYLTLNLKLMIQDINLTGAALLGSFRENVLGTSFAQFVTFWDSDRFLLLTRKMIKGRHRHSFDVALQREDGSVFQAQIDCLRVTHKTNGPTIRVVLSDVSERKRAEAKIKELAFHDPLTGLPNRRLLVDRLQQALSVCARTMRFGGIFFIDLDDFKTLNDTYGHSLGDLLLQQVANRLRECVSEGDTVARLGGDEFVVVAQDFSDDPILAASEAEQVGERVLSALHRPYLLAGHQHRTSGSVGITLFKDSEASVETIIKRADLALYRAKATGRNKIRFFDPEMEANVAARGVLDADLRLGLQGGQFVTYYQPQVNDLGNLTGAEALLRWQHPDRGLIAPMEFIPFAEEKGLINILGELVLQDACVQLMRWSESPAMSHLKLAVNISAHEFAHPQFVARLLEIVDQSGADAEKLILEFTERVMFGTIEDTLAKMKRLKSRGIGFALDDFGVGYSSLSYLHSLPLDQLKIDRTFIQDVMTNPNDAAITRSIIALGQSLGLDVIAEGVETEEQRSFLAAHGCLTYQGYLFGRPGPPEHLYLMSGEAS